MDNCFYYVTLLEQPCSTLRKHSPELKLSKSWHYPKKLSLIMWQINITIAPSITRILKKKKNGHFGDLRKSRPFVCGFIRRIDCRKAQTRKLHLGEIFFSFFEFVRVNFEITSGMTSGCEVEKIFEQKYSMEEKSNDKEV